MIASPFHGPASCAAYGLVVVVALALGACGGPQVAPCLVPPDAAAAADALEGRWELYDGAGVHIGTAELAGGRAAIASLEDDATYFGTITMTAAVGNSHHLDFAVERATVGTVEHVYGELTHIGLHILFATRDEAFSLQDNGVWVRWQRAPEVEATE
jgi:hypothetical protein